MYGATQYVKLSLFFTIKKANTGTSAITDNWQSLRIRRIHTTQKTLLPAVGMSTTGSICRVRIRLFRWEQMARYPTTRAR